MVTFTAVTLPLVTWVVEPLFLMAWPTMALAEVTMSWYVPLYRLTLPGG